MALSLYLSSDTTAGIALPTSSINKHHHHHHYYHHHNTDNIVGDLQSIIDSCALENSTIYMNPLSKSVLTSDCNQCSIGIHKIQNDISRFNGSNTNSPIDNHLVQEQQQQQQPKQQVEQQPEQQHQPQQLSIIDRNKTTDQITQHATRNVMNNLPQNITTDYGQIITYVDSPPNSEESWPEGHSKFLTTPQILNVQTIYSNCNGNACVSSGIGTDCGNRKRRMDWDSLDMNDSNNVATITINQLNNQHQMHTEKDKYKRDKLNNGRSTWSDDIGFDLNAEFNNSSYINNETFMPYSPSLAVLKQEPQTTIEQIKLQKTATLNIVPQQQTQKKTTPQQQQQQQQHQQHESPIPVTAAAATTTTSITVKHSKSVIHECQHHQQHQQQAQQQSQSQQQHQQHQQHQQRQCNTSNAINQDKITNSFDHAYNINAGINQQLLTVLNADKIDEDAITTKTPTTSISNTIKDNGICPNAIIGADDYKFQYILAAATSIATKNNEETLTYLNQGQSYEIKLKKIGDLSFYRDTILKSVIKICFHERRLQVMEHEQMQQWQTSRPGERIIEVDVPLSYGLYHVNQPLSFNYLNTVEILWDPMKEVGVYIKVNCISTEFTPKKHGGEKGVPFRLQIETYIDNVNANINNVRLGEIACGDANLNGNGNGNGNGNDNGNRNGNRNSNGNVNVNGNGGGGGSNDGENVALIINKNSPTIASKILSSPTSTSRASLPANQSPTPHQMVGNISTMATEKILKSLNFNPINIGLSRQQQIPIHAAACQIKVFKLKGADRKHKQDRERIQKRPQSEQEKFQPSYECTIMNDIALDALTPPITNCYTPERIKLWPDSPVHITKYNNNTNNNNMVLHAVSTTGNTTINNANRNSPVAFNNVSSTNTSTNMKLIDHNMNVAISPMISDIDNYMSANIMPESTPAQVTEWLTTHRLTAYLTTFAQFSGTDIMRMSKDDLIQICGLADGIRMFNILRAKAITPRLTIYVSLDGCSYHAIYLLTNTARELLQKLFNLPNFYELMTKSHTTCNNDATNANGNGNSANNNRLIDDNNSVVRCNIWPSNSIHIKYGENDAKKFDEMNLRNLLYITGPSGIHVAITDEVLINEITDGSLYGLEIQNGKVIMKLININHK